MQSSVSPERSIHLEPGAIAEQRSKLGDMNCERRLNIPHSAVRPPSTNSRAQLMKPSTVSFLSRGTRASFVCRRDLSAHGSQANALDDASKFFKNSEAKIQKQNSECGRRDQAADPRLPMSTNGCWC
jgi:hypothetical protein